MPHDFACITEMPGALLSPEQYNRFLHRYAFGLHASGLAEYPLRVLEVGCGGGGGVAAWHEASPHVVGLEYVPEALYVARLGLGMTMPLVGGDAHFLPFTNNAFDAIASFEVLYYLPNLPLFLYECHRVLADNGRLILCWSNPDWQSFVPGKHSTHYPTLAEVSTLLKAAGFGKADFYGAFAATQASAKALWVNRIRQMVVRSGFSRVLEKVATPLMRAAYGELKPLPGRLKLDELDVYAQSVTFLDPVLPDRVHRVLYAVAQATV